MFSLTAEARRGLVLFDEANEGRFLEYIEQDDHTPKLLSDYDKKS
jgi:hypothetical protein